MFLAVDAGNTKITLGFYEDDDLKVVRSFICPKKTGFSELKSLIINASSGCTVDSCMIASVVDELTANLKNAISKVFNINPLILNTEINYGINIKSEHPEKCGADRIANAYAVSRLYQQRPIIVVDSGSATTFDIVDENNDFSGGVIMPGINMQLRALGEMTSKLPVLDLNNINQKINVISDNTEEEIYAGVVIAHAQAVLGLLKLSEKELGKSAYVVGTGGNITWVNKYMNERKIDIINPNLTLDGIRLIYNLNNNKSI